MRPMIRIVAGGRWHAALSCGLWGARGRRDEEGRRIVGYNASASPAAGPARPTPIKDIVADAWPLIIRAVGSRVQAVVGRVLGFFKIYCERDPIAKKFSLYKAN